MTGSGKLCRYCGASIRWAKTKNGKWIPLELLPTDAGRWLIAMGIATCLVGVQRELAQIKGKRLYEDHRENCPNKPERIRYVPGRGLQ